MNNRLKEMPFLVISMLILIIGTFIADQMSSFKDAHWSIAEFTFDDPIYLGMSIFWLAIVIWISFDTIKRKKHIPSTLKLITIIASAFFIFELVENDISLSLFISFQFLEVALWLSAFFLSTRGISKEWFIE